MNGRLNMEILDQNIHIEQITIQKSFFDWVISRALTASVRSFLADIKLILYCQAKEEKKRNSCTL